jgi:hypothetical protein
MNSKYKYNVFNQNNNEPMRPNSVGTIHNLPDDVRMMAGLQHPDAAAADVVVWTTFDTEFEHAITTPSMVCCRIVWISVLLPCICPCVTIMSPCIYTKARAQQHAIRHQHWILTDRDVKIVILPNVVHSIPFCDIINCYVQEPSPTMRMPTLYIDTASSLARVPASVDRQSMGYNAATFYAAAGMGLVDYNWFLTEILRRRDHLKMELPTVPAASAMVEATFVVEPTTAIDRGSTTNRNESIERRIQIIVDLHHRGIVTKEEYEMKRQEIIASI